VNVPNARPMPGQAPRYVGRKHDPAGPTPFPAVEQPFCCESDSDAGRRLMKLAKRDGSLYAADEATAKVCGIEFVRIEFKDGAWVEASKSAPKSAPKGD
jgi:hypothetical protein